jgi:hypothetical protein
MTSFSVIELHRCFGRLCFLLFHGASHMVFGNLNVICIHTQVAASLNRPVWSWFRSLFAIFGEMCHKRRSSETSVKLCQISRRHIPKDSTLLVKPNLRFFTYVTE